MKQKFFKKAMVLLLCVAGYTVANAQAEPYVRVSTHDVFLSYSELSSETVDIESNGRMTVSTNAPEKIDVDINQYFRPGGTVPGPAGPGGYNPYDPYNMPYYYGYITITPKEGFEWHEIRGQYLVYVSNGYDRCIVRVTVE
ncbi:hypothetical protein DMA11_22875 [Marinilabiliaceae bacterium JC017]|nr:hypothetical protein DMA11_22875 [Marinilabiliaceae bacterium JC017]